MAHLLSVGATILITSVAHWVSLLSFIANQVDGYVYMNVEEGGDSSTWRVPIYSVTDGVLSCRSSRNTIETARRIGVAQYTPLENDALACFDALTESEALRLDMDLVRGDMQFINNYTTLHARTAYEDWPDPDRRRLMVRMWLSAHGTRRPTHASFREYDGIPKTLERPKPEAAAVAAQQ